MKSQGQEGGDCIRVLLYVHGALWGPCVYMQSVCGRGCVFEWRIKGPHVQGLHGADSWPIKRGPPKAEWKNEIEKKRKRKKHPHQRKRQQWGFLKCSAATALAEKRAYLSLKHASNPRPTMSVYKRWGWKQREQRGSGGRMEGWSDGGNRPVSFTFLFAVFHAWAVCILSATNTLFGLWSEGQSRSADAKCHIRATHATSF